MKLKLTFLSLIISILCLSGCSNEQMPVFPEEDDGYVDVLPESNIHGPILQAFNWSYSNVTKNLDAIKNSGFKIIQISPVTPPKNGGTTWWSYYQPLGFVIADSTPLGTKEELKELCEKADAQGIDIIADVVFNHLANISDNDLEADGTPKVSPQVETYEPIIYSHRNSSADSIGVTFHHIKPLSGSGSETQYYPYGKLPDLNTGNEYVQSRCLQFLKDCIDIGIDGFRFDAAKHIETPDDPQYASNFWPNTLGAAKQYYSSKFNNKQLYAYGEVLGDPIDRNISVYTKLMNVTEDNYNSKLYTAMRNKNYSSILVDNPYGKKVGNNSSLVVWDESHDDVIDANNKLASGLVPDRTTIQKYAVIASNKDITPMFLARPNANVDVGEIGNYTFESEELAAANRFANRYKDATQYLSSDKEVFINEKVAKEKDCGALILGYADGNKSRAVSLPHLPDGNYYDQVTGATVPVWKGKATINFGNLGLSILTKTKDPLRPVLTISNRGCSFYGTMELTFSSEHSTYSTYKINDEPVQPFEGSKTLTLSNALTDKDKVIKITLHAENSKYAKDVSYQYKVIELIDGYFNVINFDSSILDDYSLYEWAWSSNVAGKWIQVHHIQNNVLLCDFKNTNYTSFLLAKFPKGYIITNVNTWDNKCLAQTKDISISDGFFDAKGF